jgi:serine/threonine protein kinase/Tfp pilus assembly protein PilF
MSASIERDDPRLTEVLRRWGELQEQGSNLSAEEFLSTCPELAGETDRWIGVLREISPQPDIAEAATNVHDSGDRTPESSRDSASARAEYRELRFHAAGALGEVYLARNTELKREVAIKFLKPGRARDPDHLRRFLQEAEITGRLEHPGIVPIYALGVDAAGIPGYAMRFIRGATLLDAIEAFHAADRAGRDPSERSLALRELLGRFISICNTIAYAHSRGILHRDLKPSNVMLGKFEETLVVDWGLAKAFDRVETADGTGDEALKPTISGTGSDTPTVGIVGTPAFMSPEQAEVRSILVGPASDIFGLGAILYAILSGQGPYQGRTLSDVLDAVKRCEFPTPRQVKSEVPRALEAICLKAMALRPLDRYPTALELAADVNRWLADEPVSAYSEPLAARARRWVRRHPRLVTGGTAASIVAAAALLAIITVVSIWNGRLGDANRTIRQSSQQISAQNDELKQANQDLVQARASAEREREQAKEVTAFLVSTFRKPDPEMDGRDVKVAQVLDDASKALELRENVAPLTRAAILSAIGETYGGLGLASQSAGTLEKAVELRRRELGDDDTETINTLAGVATAYWAAGQLDRATTLGEQVLQSRRANLGDNHPLTIGAINDLAVICEDSGRLDRAIDLFQQAIAAQRAKLGDDHPDTVLFMHNLADTYLMAGQPERAVPVFEKAVNVFRSAKGATDPTTLEMTNNLARAYGATGQLDRSLELFQQVLQARLAKLGQDHPLTETSTSNLATAFLRMGQPDRAIPLLEETLARRRARPGRPNPSLFLTMNNLATAYRESGQVQRAIPLIEEALAGQQGSLGASHPETLASQLNLARAFDADGRLKDAERVYRQVIETSGRNRPRNDRFWSEALLLLGGCLIRQNQHAQAVPVLRESLEIKQKAQPGALSTAVARGLLGEALAGVKDYAAAEPLLLASQKTIAQGGQSMPGRDRPIALRAACERLFHLYEAWGKQAEAERWKRQLAAKP